MFTKNFYTRLWANLWLPVGEGATYPSKIGGYSADGKTTAYLINYSPYFSGTRYYIGGNDFSCGKGSAIITTSSYNEVNLGQYVPSTAINTYLTNKSLTFSSIKYDENTFYDTIEANTPISTLSFAAKTASDINPIYDEDSDSISKTYRYIITNTSDSQITIRSISGTVGGYSSNDYYLIWGINLDNDFIIEANESVSFNITYSWGNATPSSTLSEVMNINANIE